MTPSLKLSLIFIAISAVFVVPLIPVAGPHMEMESLFLLVSAVIAPLVGLFAYGYFKKHQSKNEEPVSIFFVIFWLILLAVLPLVLPFQLHNILLK